MKANKLILVLTISVATLAGCIFSQEVTGKDNNDQAPVAFPKSQAISLAKAKLDGMRINYSDAEIVAYWWEQRKSWSIEFVWDRKRIGAYLIALVPSNGRPVQIYYGY